MIPLETLDKMLETAKKGGAVVGFTKEQAVELVYESRYSLADQVRELVR